MVTKRESVLFLLFAALPVTALWTYQGLQAAEHYEGTCGLLDAGWACSRVQYVEYTLSSAFVFPFLAAISIAWLSAVAIATWIYSRLREQLKTT
jgi:hypothetical protein